MATRRAWRTDGLGPETLHCLVMIFSLPESVPRTGRQKSADHLFGLRPGKGRENGDGLSLLQQGRKLHRRRKAFRRGLFIGVRRGV
jgi:hypothetical protein